MTNVSVVIPTLNAADEIGHLLDLLLTQTHVPEEILVVDSSSDDMTQSIVRGYQANGVRLCLINRADFNHGATRDMAIRMTTGDYIALLTQDAVPVDKRLIENLIAPMISDSEIALVTGRQVPKNDARRFEELVRHFNYPMTPNVRDATDIPRLGIKAFFASDVCSLYRRSAYEECGGFPRVETNEDMIMVCRFLKSGYRVAYEPAACVFHSHNLTPKQQYIRNRAVGAFLERYSDELGCGSEIGEGKRMVKTISKTLVREGRIGELFAFGIDCVARLLGNRAGRRSIRREIAR